MDDVIDYGLFDDVYEDLGLMVKGLKLVRGNNNLVPVLSQNLIYCLFLS